MKKSDLLKLNEGFIFLTFGFALKGMSLGTFVCAVMAVVPACILFETDHQDLLNTVMTALPFAALYALSGLLIKVPLTILGIFVNAFVSEIWCRKASEAYEQEMGIILICFILFLIPAFFLDGLYLNKGQTILMIFSVFLPPLTIFEYHAAQIKKIVKTSKTV